MLLASPLSTSCHGRLWRVQFCATPQCGMTKLGCSQHRQEPAAAELGASSSFANKHYTQACGCQEGTRLITDQSVSSTEQISQHAAVTNTCVHTCRPAVAAQVGWVDQLAAHTVDPHDARGCRRLEHVQQLQGQVCRCKQGRQHTRMSADFKPINRSAHSLAAFLICRNPCNPDRARTRTEQHRDS